MNTPTRKTAGFALVALATFAFLALTPVGAQLTNLVGHDNHANPVYATADKQEQKADTGVSNVLKKTNCNGAAPDHMDCDWTSTPASIADCLVPSARPVYYVMPNIVCGTCEAYIQNVLVCNALNHPGAACDVLNDATYPMPPASACADGTSVNIAQTTTGTYGMKVNDASSSVQTNVATASTTPANVKTGYGQQYTAAEHTGSIVVDGPPNAHTSATVAYS